MELIKTRKQLKQVLSYEANLYHKRNTYLFRPVLNELSISWKMVCLLRYEEYHTNANHLLRRLLYKFLRKLISLRFNVYIPLNTVSEGLMMYHPHNIMINANKIGKNFSIQFNCSLVAGGHNSSRPTIGDDVTLGTGVTILGNAVIADGIAIGANSLVNKSFLDPNICIAGCPAKKISNNGSSTWGGSPSHYKTGSK